MSKNTFNSIFLFVKLLIRGDQFGFGTPKIDKNESKPIKSFEIDYIRVQE